MKMLFPFVGKAKDLGILNLHLKPKRADCSVVNRRRILYISIRIVLFSLKCLLISKLRPSVSTSILSDD